jgi:glycosyltransferase involved in cell wall biosynthesis
MGRQDRPAAGRGLITQRFAAKFPPLRYSNPVMDSLPRISVVTPSYNQGPYIEKTIQSVLTQDYPNLEYLVLDSCSTDETGDILRRYAGQLTAIIEKDKGQSDAVNKGVGRATGEIIAWLNSDDTYPPGTLQAVAAFLSAHPEIDAVYGDADYIGEDDQFIAECVHREPWNHFRLVHYSDFIVQPACFFRKSAFEAVGGLDVNIHFPMDYDLWLRMANAGHTFAYLRRKLAHFRWFGENKTAMGGLTRMDEIKRIAMRAGASGLPAYNKLELINLHLAEAAGLLRSGKIFSAVSRISRASGILLTSPRAMKSMFTPHVWRTIVAGQRLRAYGRRVRQAKQLPMQT